MYEGIGEYFRTSNFNSSNFSVDFSIDKDLHQTVVKVIDNDTKKVIRQIPSEDVLALSKRIQALQDGSDGGNTLSGLLFDRQI